MFKSKYFAVLLIMGCSINALAASNASSMIFGSYITLNSGHYSPFVLNANNDFTEWNFNTNFNGVTVAPNFFSVTCRDKVCISSAGITSDGDVKNIPLIFRSNDAGYSWDAVNVTPANVRNAGLDYVDCDQNKCFAIGEKRNLNNQKSLFILT